MGKKKKLDSPMLNICKIREGTLKEFHDSIFGSIPDGNCENNGEILKQNNIWSAPLIELLNTFEEFLKKKHWMETHKIFLQELQEEPMKCKSRKFRRNPWKSSGESLKEFSKA